MTDAPVKPTLLRSGTEDGRVLNSLSVPVQVEYVRGNDLVSYYSGDLKFIKVTPQGCSPSFVSDDGIQQWEIDPETFDLRERRTTEAAFE